MQLVASDSAIDFIRERGGRLYVWKRHNRCCGGSTISLAAATEKPPEIAFRRAAFEAAVEAGFELYLPTALGSLPDELHLEAHRFPRRVEAYWNGCAWVA